MMKCICVIQRVHNTHNLNLKLLLDSFINLTVHKHKMQNETGKALHCLEAIDARQDISKRNGMH